MMLFLCLQTNSYQAVVISDASETYTVFTYNCDRLNWIGVPPAAVGFSVLGDTDDFRNFENHGLSTRNEVGMVACNHTRFNRPWTNVVYRIGITLSAEQARRSRCSKQVLSDMNKLPSIDIPFSSTSCPCTLFQLQQDYRYKISTDINSLNFSILCFISRNPILDEETGIVIQERCCYELQRLVNI